MACLHSDFLEFTRYFYVFSKHTIQIIWFCNFYFPAKIWFWTWLPRFLLQLYQWALLSINNHYGCSHRKYELRYGISHLVCSCISAIPIPPYLLYIRHHFPINKQLSSHPLSHPFRRHSNEHAAFTLFSCRSRVKHGKIWVSVVHDLQFSDSEFCNIPWLRGHIVDVLSRVPICNSKINLIIRIW